MKTKHKIIVGIDPAFRQSGFAIAICDKTDKSCVFKVFENGFCDFVFWVLNDAPDIALWVVENSNLQQSIWSGKSLKVAQSVGKNQAASQYTCDLLEVIYGKENVKGISPYQKGKKIKSDYFKTIVKALKYELFNYKGNAQDKRDAFMCAAKYL